MGIVNFNHIYKHSRKGKIFIVSGPSGAGKNTVIKGILKFDDIGLHYIPSFTTRSIRKGESQGNPYIFVDNDGFQKMVERGEFLEFEQIHGNLYGTHFKTYQEAIENGYDTIKDIDVLGALNFKKHFPDDVVLIYIRPSDINELKKRLIDRGDEYDDIERRMQRIEFEESKRPLFDFVVYNDNVEDAISNLKEIILKESLNDSLESVTTETNSNN